jgi:16S rRNA (guanine(966)-N(2))-methyltransferase RsmD
MRIIAGNLKGAVLKTPSGLKTRPMLARIKKSLFSIFQNQVGGARFLDLFAGSGSVGIEAISRGAALCCFVDNDKQCIEIIKQNIQRLKINRNAEVIRSDVFRAIKRLAGSEEKFNIIFVGPPYGLNLEHLTLQALSRQNVLHRHGSVIVQSHKSTELSDSYLHLHLSNTRLYGDTRLSFYKSGEIGK